MTDLLGIGASGVRAYQAALAITGDNVANADTPGYVRRTVTLSTGPSGAGTPLSRDRSGGAGVLSGDIGRATDALKLTAARNAAGAAARFVASADWQTRLQGIVADSDLDARIGGLFDAATDLAAAPTSTAARVIFLDRAGQAAGSFSSLGASLAALADDIQAATDTGAGEVNAIVAALAGVNDELRRTQAGGNAANGLLDRRDTLLADLADRIRIDVTISDRGTATVRLGAGGGAPVLVPDKGAALRIAVRDGASGAELVLDPTHRAEVIRLPASGSLAGLIDAARQVTAARAEVDVLATRFATGVNAQAVAGTDALGDPGQPLFNTDGLSVRPGKANGGSAGIDVTIADGAALAPGGYRLLKDSAGWTLSRADGSATVTGPGTITLDGVTVRPGAGARDGDGWFLDPAGGAIGMSLRPIGPERLAVADRFIADADSGNRGDGAVVLDTDPAAAAFVPQPPYRVTITAGGTADITDIATGTLLLSAPIDGSRIIGAGFGITLTGTPVAGDSFRILTTGAGSSDNGNALKFADVRAAIGPGGTIEASLDAGIARIGSSLAETDRLRATAMAVASDAALAADAVSGVDLDREAAELTRLQTAYRANAQVIAAARDLFDTLIGISR
ncbi:FlgK family flagellar hook-associated protein [Sandarakinorhabdus sp. DWP1-3-1]|uniref:FlgK family flagellar hook-associated protein n=1 Tax=Sandarakinorhabdus sp. DWP1-3-1 TaxID=2804627 RepID=UPI003CED9E5C